VLPIRPVYIVTYQPVCTVRGQPHRSSRHTPPTFTSLSTPDQSIVSAKAAIPLSLAQYRRFFLVGTVVGLLAIALRELIAAALPADTPLFYSISVIVVYVFGILLSYVLQHRFTFKVDLGTSDWRRLTSFIAVALIGALTTWLLSLIFRYELGFDRIFGLLSGSIAFGVAALSSSVLTYALNALVVFRRS
jgi:putative flippase GtrA